MKPFLAFLSRHKVVIAGILLFLLLLWGVYAFGKKAGSGNVLVDESVLSSADKAKANEIALRIHEDINSGVLGYNPFGNIGRDTEALEQMALMSDTLFGYTCQRYREQFGSSLITDLRNESSLDTGSFGSGSNPYDLILQRASKLTIA